MKIGLNMATSINRKLGHVVLNVSSLARSVPFYESLLGISEVARMDEAGRKIVGAEMVFFSFGDSHHDLGLREFHRGQASYLKPWGLPTWPSRLAKASRSFTTTPRTCARKASNSRSPATTS